MTTSAFISNGQNVPQPAHGNPAWAQSLLCAETVVKSLYEKVFKECLLERGVTAWYEPRNWVLGPFVGKTITYKPDFITDLTLNGRQVILETHPMAANTKDQLNNDLFKFSRFKAQFGNKFYLIMASDLSEVVINFRSRIPLSDSVHEYWEMPYIRLSDTTGMSEAQAKEIVRSHIDGLLRRAR
jgi:hypothetical protein